MLNNGVDVGASTGADGGLSVFIQAKGKGAVSWRRQVRYLTLVDGLGCTGDEEKVLGWRSEH